MKTRATVLGCGLVGATIARELAGDAGFDVTVADVSGENLARLARKASVRTQPSDLSDPARVKDIVKDSDIVLGAMPSRIGLQTLRAVIECGKRYCDISFMSEDATQLDALARKHDVTAVVDCGVSPGLSNMMIGYACTQLDQADRAVIYVGGLPKRRTWPFQYQAPFAPSDVVEEYVRPARLVESGRIVVRPALSEPELIDFPKVGTLEAFNTDGLRSLLTTVRVPDMREKTLRYPGHCELMRVLRETGFFRTDTVSIAGGAIRPRDLTAKLLFPKWNLSEGDEEFTLLHVTVEGKKAGRAVRHTFDLYDENDPVSGASSMARTTGFPCAIVARMIAAGRLREPGVHPPESIARQPGVFSAVVAELGQRGVNVKHEVTDVENPG